MRLLRRLAGFTFLPLIGMLAPIVVLPIVARVGGPLGWQSIGVGQSVGVVASIAVMWGWWATGPPMYIKLNNRA